MPLGSHHIDNKFILRCNNDEDHLKWQQKQGGIQMVRGKGNQFQSAVLFCLFVFATVATEVVWSFYFRSYQEDNSGPVIWDRYIKKCLSIG